MNEQRTTEWFERLGRAWTALNPEAVLELFADNVEYHDSPLAQPLLGREAVLTYWRKAAESEKDVEFTFKLLAIQGDEGLVEWGGSFVRVPSEKFVRCAGVIGVTLDDEGKCRRFREWRVTHEE